MPITKKRLNKIKKAKQQSRKCFKKNKKGGNKNKKYRNKHSFRKKKKYLNLKTRTLKRYKQHGGVQREVVDDNREVVDDKRDVVDDKREVVDDKEDIRKIFKQIDTNSSNSISLDELIAYYKLSNSENADTNAKNILKEFSDPPNDILTEEQFIQWTDTMTTTDKSEWVKQWMKYIKTLPTDTKVQEVKLNEVEAKDNTEGEETTDAAEKNALVGEAAAATAAEDNKEGKTVEGEEATVAAVDETTTAAEAGTAAVDGTSVKSTADKAKKKECSDAIDIDALNRADFTDTKNKYNIKILWTKMAGFDRNQFNDLMTKDKQKEGSIIKISTILNIHDSQEAIFNKISNGGGIIVEDKLKQHLFELSYQKDNINENKWCNVDPYINVVMKAIFKDDVELNKKQIIQRYNELDFKGKIIETGDNKDNKGLVDSASNNGNEEDIKTNVEKSIKLLEKDTKYKQDEVISKVNSKLDNKPSNTGEVDKSIESQNEIQTNQSKDQNQSNNQDNQGASNDQNLLEIMEQRMQKMQKEMREYMDNEIKKMTNEMNEMANEMEEQQQQQQQQQQQNKNKLSSAEIIGKYLRGGEVSLEEIGNLSKDDVNEDEGEDVFDGEPLFDDDGDDY